MKTRHYNLYTGILCLFLSGFQFYQYYLHGQLEDLKGPIALIVPFAFLLGGIILMNARNRSYKALTDLGYFPLSTGAGGGESFRRVYGDFSLTFFDWTEPVVGNGLETSTGSVGVWVSAEFEGTMPEKLSAILEMFEKVEKEASGVILSKRGVFIDLTTLPAFIALVHDRMGI